jgi:hypothetical protein
MIKNNLLLALLIAFYFGKSNPTLPTRLSFTENKGQVYDQNNKPRPDVLFSGSDGKMVYHILKNGISYQMSRIDSYSESFSPNGKAITKVPKDFTIYRVDASWKNCNTAISVEHDKAEAGVRNSYHSSSTDGALNIRSYSGITLKNLYNKIDLHYYSKDGSLKYDYIVAPGANYHQIQIEFKGADPSLEKNGNVILHTPLGEIEEGAPLVYQNGKQLTAKWMLKENVLSLDIKDYNPEYTLIIDPLVRNWGTYFGDQSDDKVNSCTTDSIGNVYIAGETGFSAALYFIATAGAHQSTHAGGAYDAFVAKLNASGVVQWCTYYGGNGDEFGKDCAVDRLGNVYLTGSTGSTNGIASAGAFQVAKSGIADMFLVKFNSSGVRQWGTFYGGAGAEGANSCVVDNSGNIFVTGSTTSTGAMATFGAHQATHGGGTLDGFLAKFTALGVRQWCTYYGGADSDVGYACALDNSGNVYISGQTGASSTGTAIATAGSHQTSTGEGFLAKFNTSGTRQWGTYYNGPGYACASDKTGGFVYLAGSTSSGSGISTSGSHQTSIDGSSDAFLAKFDLSGVRQWGTYYGNTGADWGLGCNTDASGNVYLAGYTAPGSNTLSIATADAHQTMNFGLYNGYVSQFNSSGTRLWATFYGGSGTDIGTDCAVDLKGNIYLCGQASSNSGTGIATPGSHQPLYRGGAYDGYLVKFCYSPAAPAPISGPSSWCTSSSGSFSVAPVSGALYYVWTLPSGWSGSTFSNIISTTPGASGTVSVTVTDGCSVSPPAILNVTVNPLPTVVIAISDSSICGPPWQETSILTASGASTYSWSTGSTSFSISVSPSVTTNYTVTGTDGSGCKNSATITQTVSGCVGIMNVNADATEINIFPNPGSGQFTILLNSQPKNCKLEVYNQLGQLVYDEMLKSSSSKIDLDKFPSGIYQFIITGDDKTLRSKKVVKD